MNDERFKELQQAVDDLETNGIAGELDRKFTLFRNADEAMRAIRANKVPGVTWTDECEAKYQTSKKMYEALDEKHPWNLED